MRAGNSKGVGDNHDEGRADPPGGGKSGGATSGPGAGELGSYPPPTGTWGYGGGTDFVFALRQHRGGFLSAPKSTRLPSGPRPWYRRRPVYLLAALVVAGASYFVDRYDTYTSPERVAALSSFRTQMLGDLAGCTQGIRLVDRAWRRLGPAPSQGQREGQLRFAKEVESNCTPVNSDIYSLLTMQVPGALSQAKQVANLALYDVGAWAYPHAARALLDVETLLAQPGNRAGRARLAAESRSMLREADAAQTNLNRVASILGTHLPPLHLPAPPRPPA
jgi:hypothetical protein